MQTVCNKWIVVSASALLFLGTASNGFALFNSDITSLRSEVQRLAGEEVVPTCEPSQYSPAAMGAPPIANCTSCQNTIKSARQAVVDVYPQAEAATVNANTSSTAGAQAAAAATNGHQENTQGQQRTATNIGSKGLMTKAQAAGALATAANDCMQKLNNQCSGVVGDDESRAREAHNLCETIAQKSKAIAADKAGAGMDMGSLAQLAGAAAQALGALKPNQSPSSVSSTPYTPPKVAQSAPGGSSLAGSGDKVGSVGFSGASNTPGAEFKNTGTGFAPEFTARSFAPDPDLAASLGGNDPGSFNGDAPSIASTGASGGAGGLGARNSSGSSTMGEKPGQDATAKELGQYELPSGGGGGGSKPFLGLKSKSSDLGDLAGGESAPGVLGDLGLGDEGRELASDEYGSDIGAADGGTLFKVIHTKYAEMKRRGSI